VAIRAGEKRGEHDAKKFLENLQSEYPSLKKLDLVEKTMSPEE
jgi:hypothetical protein